MPSMPWGSSRTMPFCLTHLACPGQMNWSIMHWAVLWKSPNWASQSTRALGLAMAKPSSKPVGGRGGGGGGHLPGAPPHGLALGVGAEPPAHQGRRTRTGSCCRRCREPGWATGGSWGCRSSCPRSGRAGRGGDGWKRGQHISTITPPNTSCCLIGALPQPISPSRLVAPAA